MSTKPPQPPNPVPEEDLNLHEDFSPVIAENGLIRQPKAPEMNEESLPAFLTRLDTLQDLVALRRLEQQEQTGHLEQSPATTAPLAGEDAQRTVAGEKESFVPLEGEDAQRADEGESKLKNNPYKNNTDLSPAATTFLTVREPETTALVPVSKLTLARRIKLLKRKRQRKRRLAARAKKRAAQAAVPPKTPKQQPSPARPSRWKWVFVLLLLLFLGGVSGLVPVEKIPLLRNLAYAMGFDKNDTSRISFLRALLTWTDKTIGLPGNWSNEAGENYLWARWDKSSRTGGVQADETDATGLNARFARADSQTSLIDMKALQALQLKKGYVLDGVRGAVKLTPGQEEADLGPAVVRDDKVNVRTEANRDKGEVFFGSDRAAVNRNFKDGYDSTKMLAKIKNPHIADGKPIDWLLNTTQQLMQTNSPLGGLNRQLEGSHVSWGSGLANLGEQKPHRDLYSAWITSRMGNRTPNIMLKKSLADVGFLGADMPTMASTALGGGVQIESTSFQEDQEAWKEYLEFERRCKEELGAHSLKIDKALEDFGKFRDKPGYPTTCDEMLNSNSSNFLQNVKANVQSACTQLRENYKALERNCAMAISEGTDCKNITTEKYEDFWKQDQAYCEDKLKELKENCKKANQGTDCDAATLENYKKTADWQKVSTKNGKDIENTVKEDGSQFATLIRGKEIEPGKWVAEDQNKEGDPSQQLENVRRSIGENISPVFKK